jgi:hypothetical protein
MLGIASAAMIAVINVVAVMIFEIIGPLEKCISYSIEDEGILRRIGIVQFFNIGLLFFVTEFTFGGTNDSGLPFFGGLYRDFDTIWFQKVGVKIMFAMLSNSLAPHSKVMMEPFI